MEVKIIILGMSPRLPYLKNDITDSFSMSFLYNDNIIKIEDLETNINKGEPINISFPDNFQKEINFCLIRNGTQIIGMGEIPLVNCIKWFNLTKLTSKELNFGNINSKIGDTNINNLNKDKNNATSSSKNNDLFQEIINSYNIKFNFSIEIINNNENTISKNNLLQKSISLKGSVDSGSNSIANTCSNSKTPKMMKNTSINLIPKNNNTLVKNNNTCFKKIDLYQKNKNNNSTLFSSINNKLLRNQTEKKLFHKKEKKGKIFSFNDYYDINFNSNTNTDIGVENDSKSNKTNIFNLTNCKNENTHDIFNKRKKLPTNIEQFTNTDNLNHSSKLLNELIIHKKNFVSNKKYKNKSNKKLTFKNKNLFDKSVKNISIKPKMQEDINNTSFKKIEDVIIDQNFKNEIKNDELIGFTSNNSSIISSFYSTKNIFFNSTNENFNIDSNKERDDILVIYFNDKKNNFFQKYNSGKIKLIQSNLLLLEFHSFLNKIMELGNDYQIKYKELYLNLIQYKQYIDLFKFLYLKTLKKKNKLDYIKSSLLIEENKNKLINIGISFYSSRKKIISEYKIPFWENILSFNNKTKSSNTNKNNRKKNELIKIFINVCEKNEKYFNSLSKKCYNDIKSKYCKEKENKVIKTYYTRYCSPTKFNQINQNDSSLNMKKYSTKNYFYPSENMKNSKNKIKSYKNSNFKKEGLVIEGYKTSSLFNKNVKKK
jgi:hypothetical protein